MIKLKSNYTWKIELISNQYKQNFNKKYTTYLISNILLIIHLIIKIEFDILFKSWNNLWLILH